MAQTIILQKTGWQMQRNEQFLGGEYNANKKYQQIVLKKTVISLLSYSHMKNWQKLLA